MAGKAKIFVVEDEEILAQSLTEYLRNESYEVEVAHDGETALQILPTVRPDLIILDIVLPKLNGIVFLKKIQEAGSEFNNIPVIIISNLSGNKESIEQMGLHIAEYFVKTVGSLKELTAKIKSILKDNG